MSPAKKQSKTDAILSYLIDNANSPAELSAISAELGFDAKVVATIASRLASRGYIRKVKRGVYVYEEKPSVTATEVEIVCASLAESVERMMGPSLVKKMGIEVPAKDRDTFEDLEGFVTRLRGAMGTKPADELLSVVVRRELPPKKGDKLLHRLGL